MALGIILGVVLIAVSYVYFTKNAGSIPTWFPGYTAGSTHMHTKHGIASLLLGLAALVFAWFQTGKKSATPIAPAGTPPKI